ncbi:MAG: methionyl-tRNA formyltransferase [Tannerella sp.]|jgi:methionyl-tRNA formyltransferase|nr:methionyl-tRNA formyltransferase [Tannerella sp.]
MARIVFMGTPEFAVESLRALVDGGYNVVGVVTAPDKPAGKHQNILQASPVKRYAISKNLPLMQPEKLKDPVFLEQLKALRADIQVIVAFRMLPEVVWTMPKLGTFNLHASLLPQYRGAAPINWAIINGEKETGVTTFLLDCEIDTGKILFQEKIPIHETDNSETVHDKLMVVGSQLVLKTVDAIVLGTVKGIEQRVGMSTVLRSAPKIFKEICRIDWTKTVEEIYNFVRGLSPYPAAWTDLATVNLKVFDVGKIFYHHTLPAGTIVCDGKDHLDVAVADGFIRLNEIQQTGKRRMKIGDFLRGNGKKFQNV